LTAETKGPEGKSALSGFGQDFSTFNAELKTKLKNQEDRLHMLEQKNTQYSRPALSVVAEVAVPHKKAFSAYLRSGHDEAMRSRDSEAKALSTAVAADGGEPLEPTMEDRTRGVLRW